MRPGEAWYTNVNLPHSVANKGKTNKGESSHRLYSK